MGQFRDFVGKLGAAPDAVNNLGDLDAQTLARLTQAIAAEPQLKWKIMQRGFWTHGVDNVGDYLRSAEQFTMEGRAGAIACPTLLTQAENDPLARGAQDFFDRLACPKALLHFSAAEGAGSHCEMHNRSLLNRRVLDWLDGVLFHL